MITFFLFRRIGCIEITIAINIFPHLGKWLKPS